MAMARTEARSFDNEPCTESDGHSQRCSNPFCNARMKDKNKHAAVKRFCSDRCRLDGYVLRRAKAMVERVGIEEFESILQRIW